MVRSESSTATEVCPKAGPLRALRLLNGAIRWRETVFVEVGGQPSPRQSLQLILERAEKMVLHRTFEERLPSEVYQPGSSIARALGIPGFQAPGHYSA